jgi:hypothetical protein
MSRSINLELSSTAATLVLGIRLKREVRFTLAPSLLPGRSRPWSKWTLSALLPIPTLRAEHKRLQATPRRHGDQVIAADLRNRLSLQALSASGSYGSAEVRAGVTRSLRKA